MYIDKKAGKRPNGMIALLGIPFDEASSFMRGPALAPPRIREAFLTESSNLSAENGMDIETTPGWQDEGDLTLSGGNNVLDEIESAIQGLLSRSNRVLTLGGDHSITYPILCAYAAKYPGLNVLQIDAHPDLYDHLLGDRYTHASPFARIMESGLVARLVQVGIRTATPHQRDQAARFGVEMIEMKDCPPAAPLAFDGPLYLSLDLDGLDPAFAPGVSHHEPGGLTTREVVQIIQGLKAPLVGADIVEYNPRRDLNGATGMVAAKFLKEILAKMLEQGG